MTNELSPEVRSAVIGTDDAAPDVVIREIIRCASSWVPEARLLGNVRACDIRRALEQAIIRGAKAEQKAPSATMESLLSIIDGIDQESTYVDGGWWETSKGSEFGADVKQKLIALFSKLEDKLATYRKNDPSGVYSTRTDKETE